MAIPRNVSDADAGLRRLACQQRSLLTREQIMEAGISVSGLSRRVAAGALRRIHGNVFALPGSDPTLQQTALAAVMATKNRGVCSGPTAAALMNLDGADAHPSRIDLTVPTAVKMSLPGATLHRSDLPEMDRWMWDGIPITSPARTLLDLGASMSKDRVELALEDALRRGLVKLPRLRWQLQVSGGRGRPGARTLASLVADRPAGFRPTGSVLEVKVERVLRRHFLPPERQFTIKSGGRFVARVDFAYPEQRLIVEADGYRFHGGRGAWVNDARKRNIITSLGWRLVIATEESLRGSPPALVSDLLPFFGRSVPGDGTDAPKKEGGPAFLGRRGP